MTNIPSGTEIARPFVPAKDLELSKRFYSKLGFEKILDSEVVIHCARALASSFFLGSGGVEHLAFSALNLRFGGTVSKSDHFSSDAILPARNPTHSLTVSVTLFPS